MGAIIDYIERTGKGKYQCFNTKKLCLDADDRDTIAYNYDDKAIAKATRSEFAETDHTRVKAVSLKHMFNTKKCRLLSLGIFLMARDIPLRSMILVLAKRYSQL